MACKGYQPMHYNSRYNDKWLLFAFIVELEFERKTIYWSVHKLYFFVYCFI